MLTIFILDHGETFEVRVRAVDQDVFFLVIGDLKQRIPPHLRNYNPAWKAWFIKAEATDQLTRWVEQARDTFAATVEGDGGPWGWRKPNWQSSYDAPPPRRPRAVSSEAEALAALYLLPGAPGPVIRAAYREMAKLNHPDHGGDTAAMQKVNNAFDMLKGRIAA